MKHKLASVVLACAIALMGAGQAGASPILVATGAFSGSVYELYLETSGINWDIADANAVALGGTLAVLETSAENVFVAGLVAANPSLYNDLGLGPWLGGFSPSKWAAFQWVNGAPFSFAPAPWQGGQPDWAEPGAMGLLYYNGGAKSGFNWGDYGQANGVGGPAGIVKGYVVELPVPEPASLLLLGTGLVGLGYARRKRRR